jgi:outer membrane protein W
MVDAHAQSGLSDTRITVFGGASFLGAERTFNSDSENGSEVFKTKYASGMRFGFRATASLTDRVSFEGSYSLGRHDLQVTEIRSIPVTRVFNTKAHQFSGNALFYLSGLAENWKPFITGGVGITRFNPLREAVMAAETEFFNRPANLSPSNKFGVNVGGGTEYQMNNNFGFRMDVRNHFMAVPRLGVSVAPTVPGLAYYPVTGRANNLEASAGLVFYLP